MARSNAALDLREEDIGTIDLMDEDVGLVDLMADDVGFVDLMDEDVELEEDGEPTLSFDDFEMWFEDEPEPMPALSHAGPRRLSLVQSGLGEAEVSLPLVVHRAAIHGSPCDAVQAFLCRQIPEASQEPEAAAVVLWARHELYLYASQPPDQRDRSSLEEARKALSKQVPEGAGMLKAWRTALRMIAES
jgi:hypothetical protein